MKKNNSIKLATIDVLLNFLGIYYEEGCAHKFLVWLKAWSGVIGVLSLIIIALEVSQFFFSRRQCQLFVYFEGEKEEKIQR